MSSNENEKQDNEAERLLVEFFRSERPTSWPEPPWPQRVAVRRAGGSRRARSVLVAALVLAAVGLSSLGEVPSPWPDSREPFAKGTMQASRPSASTHKTPPLPGFRVPELPKKEKSSRP